MFLKKLKVLFLIITILGTIFLIYNYYENYQFKNNPLNKEIQTRINKKHRYLEIITYKRFNIKRKFPVLISDKMPAKLFGAATYNTNKEIKIFLNKKRFRESIDYMINNVLPHEYAHALMFINGNHTNKNGGHTLTWQNICKKLEGQRCDRFINNNDVVTGKLHFFKDNYK